MAPVRVLLIEDNPGDVRLTRLALEEAAGAPGEPAGTLFDIAVAGRLSDGLGHLAEHDVDAVLLDLTLPDSGGLDTFLRLRAAAPDVPVVVMTGMADDAVAAQAVSQGAQDYLVKGEAEAPLLVRSLRYAVARKHAELARAASIREHAAREQAEAQARENERLLREAQAALRTREEFLSVAAHELKTPVTSLRGNAQLLLRRFERAPAVDPERIRTALSTIEQQSGKLARLVAQLLDVSRLEGGMLSVAPEPTDLLALVEEAAAVARNTTARHTIRVEALPAGTPVTALVDPLRIEQVVLNLLDNAIKYSPDGGEILVQVGPADAGKARFAVRDHGVGIPARHRAGIFQRYYQAHLEDGVAAASTSTMVGLGLGLYISNHIVAQHLGQIDVQHPEEGGTCFVVTLPGLAVAESARAR
ncbi:MAG: hypothetical protein AVDCRST_MAG77-6277 [uncultured Chloroflexi bacterium]|uniref:histidine kinase n=1 Tax=uncultured Chloroflexota bacterium TaxID=166587 RepID=A0A6J4KG28_9CHLR|nr:MAG: hypothetical protein AVDCRST_MAG77-6277 [uncultured Chloroflexota bacterium]